VRTAPKISKMTSGSNRDRHQEISRHTEGNAPLGTGAGAWPAAMVWPAAVGWPVGVEEGQDHGRQAYLWNHRPETLGRFWMKTVGTLLVCAIIWAFTR
jgi:hypothetical protein